MKKLPILTLIVAFTVSLFSVQPSYAEKKPLIKSTVVDVNGKPIQGAYIFFYDSPDTKRAVDLVSPVTDKKGFCQKEIPQGSYWVLARLKREGDFDMGPLMIEDKVSAEPKEIKVSTGEVLELKFTIMDLLDTIRTSTKQRNDLNRITGVIKNDNGEVQAKAFVFASSHNRPSLMPGYFSAWTGDDGRYTLFLPDGKYYLGISRSFAPNLKYQASHEITVSEDMADQELLLPAEEIK